MHWNTELVFHVNVFSDIKLSDITVVSMGMKINDILHVNKFILISYTELKLCSIFHLDQFDRMHWHRFSVSSFSLRVIPKCILWLLLCSQELVHRQPQMACINSTPIMWIAKTLLRNLYEENNHLMFFNTKVLGFLVLFS